MQRIPDEGGSHIAPDRMGRSPPLAGAQDFAGAVDVLEPRGHEGEGMPLMEIVSVELAD